MNTMLEVVEAVAEYCRTSGTSPTLLEMSDPYALTPENWKNQIPFAQHPGCYLFLDEDGKLLYIGKANNLGNRVSSYYSGGRIPGHHKWSVPPRSFHTIRVGTPDMAYNLEQFLIKKLLPPDNIAGKPCE